MKHERGFRRPTRVPVSKFNCTSASIRLELQHRDAVTSNKDYFEVPVFTIRVPFWSA